MLEPLFQMIYIIKRLQINLNKNDLVIFIVFHGIVFWLVLYNDFDNGFYHIICRKQSDIRLAIRQSIFDLYGCDAG